MKVSKTMNYPCIFLGCLLIFIGTYFALISTFWYLPGSGRTIDGVSFLIGILIIVAGTIILLLITKKKRNRASIFSIVLIIVAILSYNVYYVINLDDGYKPSPGFYCEIDSFNDTENMIKWIVKDTYGDDTISRDDCELRLVNISSSYNPIEANIIYQDSDNSNSITNGDIFEVYAPDDGFYTFQIISSGSLVFSSDNKY